MTTNTDGLTGRFFRWNRNGWSWNGGMKGRTFRRNPSMRAWVQQGYNEAAEEPYEPEEEGTYLGAVVRFVDGPRLGLTLRLQGVFDREAIIPHLAQMERALQKSLMFYDLLGITDGNFEMAKAVEKFGSEEAFVAACDDWEKRHEWEEWAAA